MSFITYISVVFIALFPGFFARECDVLGERKSSNFHVSDELLQDKHLVFSSDILVTNSLSTLNWKLKLLDCLQEAEVASNRWEFWMIFHTTHPAHQFVSEGPFQTSQGKLFLGVNFLPHSTPSLSPQVYVFCIKMHREIKNLRPHGNFLSEWLFWIAETESRPGKQIDCCWPTSKIPKLSSFWREQCRENPGTPVFLVRCFWLSWVDEMALQIARLSMVWG